MEFQGFPKIPRYSRECCITEKIDGTCSQIAIDEEGNIQFGSKNRWLTPEADNFGFCKWCLERKEELLKLGPGHHFGEFWGQGIQRGYGLKEKRFSLFNTRKWNYPAVRPACCHVVPVIMQGMFSSRLVHEAMDVLNLGSWAAPGFFEPEGIVIYHTAGNLLFKKTFRGDEKGKGE